VCWNNWLLHEQRALLQLVTSFYLYLSVRDVLVAPAGSFLDGSLKVLNFVRFRFFLWLHNLYFISRFTLRCTIFIWFRIYSYFRIVIFISGSPV